MAREGRRAEARRADSLAAVVVDVDGIVVVVWLFCLIGLGWERRGGGPGWSTTTKEVAGLRKRGNACLVSVEANRLRWERRLFLYGHEDTTAGKHG